MGCTSDYTEGTLRSRVEDTVRLCDKRNAPCFLGFLDLREQAIARECMRGVPAEQWGFWGGHKDAERAFLVVCPPYMEAQDVLLPIQAVAFRYRSVKPLSHRDFLGTLLSTGIRRDKIGDILCGEGLSVVFLSREIVDYVCEQVDKIGGEGVTIVTDYDGDLPISRSFVELHETVASPRLDAVVKALLHCSRESAAQLIRTGLVSLDHRPIENVSLQLTAPCTVSVRGSGRYLIDQLGPETKKGRVTLLARKCI